MKTYLRDAAVLVLFVLLVVLTGCSTKAAQQTEFMKSHDIEVTRREAQILVNAMTLEVSGIVEVAVEEMLSSTDDPLVRKRAQLWRVHAIPAFHKAAFQADPLAGYIDTAGLAFQMEDYFTTGIGRERFGDLQPIAVQASAQVVEEVVRTGRSYIERDRPAIDAWVAAHPIDNHLFIRKDASEALAKEIIGDSVGTLAVAAEMNEQMQALNDRLAIQTFYLPRQVRWHSGLILADTSELIDQKTATVLGQSTLLLDGVEAIVDHQADSLMIAVGAERAVIIETLRQERELLLLTLQQERLLILEAIRAERQAALDQVGDMTLGVVGTAFDEGEVTAAGVVDHVFFRAALLLALPFLIVLLGTGWIVLTFKRELHERNRLMAESLRARQ